MPILHLLLVASIQGLTEFLPVSSSGHLILLPNLTGLKDQGQVIDIAVHIGTLAAVLLYFRQDVGMIVRGLPRLLRRSRSDEGAWLARCLIVATVPVVVFGLALKLTGIDEAMRSTAVIGWTMLVFGLVLYWTDQKGESFKDDGRWSIRDAWIMGLWQALALIPGTSRSGIAISAGRWLGYRRQGAVRLAMLMSIPAILASGAVLGTEVIATADLQTARDAAIAAAMSFVAALIALVVMMRMLHFVSFTPYVIYRVVLGIVLLWWAYF